MKKVAVVCLVLALAIGFVLMLRGSSELSSDEVTARLVALLEEGDTAGAEKFLAESAESALNGSIEVSGIIRDENGIALDAVSLSYRETHLATIAANAYSKLTDTMINGEFNLACTDCSAIEADFSKSGYYTVDREWIAFAPGERHVNINQSDLVITLRRRGEPARLNEYMGQLETISQELVLPFGFDSRSVVMTTEQISDRASTENLSGIAYIGLSTATTSEGAIEIEQVTLPGTNFPIDIPAQAELQFFGQEGGFLHYQPEALSISKVEQEMSLAPANGYSERLNVDAFDGRLQYFYCRIGNRFCRGTVRAAGVIRSNDSIIGARASVSIELNVVEGDRNLTPR